MAVTISPIFGFGVNLDNNGAPLSGGKLFAYEGGSWSILKATFTTSVGDVVNTNPIVLDSSGRLATSLWLTSGEAYNLVLTKADGTTVLESHDNVSAGTA